MTQFPKVPTAGSWKRHPSPDDAETVSDSSTGAATATGSSGRLGPLDGGSSKGGGFGSASSGSAWGSSGTSISTTKAPEGLLYIALGAAFAALLLSALLESVFVAGISWTLAAPVGLGAATMFVVQNAKRQTSPWYLHSSRPQLLYRAAVVMCFLAVVAASVRIALFVGRM